MCMTCGCGIGQTLIAGHAIQRPRKPGGEMHYRVREEGAAHAHPHGHTHDPIDFGTGPAGTHAPGMSQARMVKIERDILAKNNGYADQNRRYLSAHSIFALNLVSSPGSGKTTLLVKTIGALNPNNPLNIEMSQNQGVVGRVSTRHVGLKSDLRSNELSGMIAPYPSPATGIHPMQL